MLSGGLRPPATVSQPFGLQCPQLLANLIQVSKLTPFKRFPADPRFANSWLKPGVNLTNSGATLDGYF
jgi:hypothetical protein